MNNVAAPRDNVVFIQILRGLAPIPVVLAHIPQIWLTNTGNQWWGAQFYIAYILQPLQLNGGGGKLGVVLFFLISGFIISMIAQHETRGEFLIKRIFRIFPALIFATFIGYLTFSISRANGWGPIFSNDAETIMDFVKSAFMISWLTQAPRALSVAWSLMPELIFYGMVFAIIPTMKAKPIPSTLALMAMYCLLAAPMAAVPYFAYLGHFTVWLPLFVVGRVFYLSFVRSITGQQAIAFTALNLMLFITIYSSKFPDDLFKNYGMAYNIGFGCSIFYLMMVLSPERCPSVIAFLSRISYSLYLVHLSVGVFILNALASSEMPFTFKTSFAIGLSVVVAAISFYVVEQPAQRVARRLLGGRPRLGQLVAGTRTVGRP